jgi:TPR repeat protein
MWTVNTNWGDTGSAIAPSSIPRERSAISAWYWTCLAATGGHPAAQSLVGFWLAQNGPNRRIPHVPRDLAKAYMWYSLSAGTGRPTGKAGRDRIAATMTSAELESAEKQLAEWEPNSEECGMSPPIPVMSQAEDPMSAPGYEPKFQPRRRYDRSTPGSRHSRPNVRFIGFSSASG